MNAVLRDSLFFLLPTRQLACFFFLFFPHFFQQPSKDRMGNYAATPLWLPDNNPLLLLCAPFYFKDIKILFFKDL